MWLTTRHEGFDGNRPTHRKPGASSFMDRAVASYLRFGLLYQFLAMSGLIVSHYAFEGEGFYTWEGRYTTAEMRSNDNYRLTLVIFTILYLIGAIYIAAFQTTLADDSAWARGYRAGSKFMAHGAIFDTISAVMCTAGALNFYKSYTDSYWTHFREGNLDWIFGAGARVLHGIAWLLYAQGYVLLEIYHDEGTNDWHGILNWFLFMIGGIIEISVLFLADPAVGIAFAWVAVLSALVWAMAFEQELSETSPTMNESELCNELEREVEKFTRTSPLNLHKFGGPSASQQMFETA
eukprot:Gregarina_sp_Poly_1__9815@NODE_629_length_7064_cov_625_434043_g482_i0_p3_GENE_NODE_629_length_7064_cov_625_434043_g482_i0NODE_629_length_7064_cov_625_434043_g482_i0_p3_ORF_typecomplete_len293_score21_69DUF3273/PF11677_8/1e59SdpI/PF13630_6/2_2e03SdpI/PF13630_6/0_2SdpI/PF13630_6/20DKCLD/PF08068_12/2_3e02DKCLD/PF08068_12/2_7ECFribofla_trS/PF07155_12/68ECFribofla_trS/PF07155_12/1_1_NODE_629_length_7064_cov_625_434043_g482_i054936371